MAYANYNEFRSAVLLMLDGDDIDSNIQPASVDQMIALGEALVHYGNQIAPDGRNLGPLRASSMEVALSGVTAGNSVAIPADCMELSILWLDDGAPIEIQGEIELRRRLQCNAGGDVRFAAQAGDNIIFFPEASDGQALNGRYYAKPAPLIDGLHATFNRFPELYLYAALFSSAPFLGFDDRIRVWQGYYAQLLDQANTQESMRVANGGRLRMVPR
mgnify:CR=1 FL=1